MTSGMQVHFSASTIKAVLHSLHMVCEQYGILIWSLQRYGVHSMQLKPPRSESTCLLHELREQERFVCETSNGVSNVM